MSSTNDSVIANAKGILGDLSNFFLKVDNYDSFMNEIECDGEIPTARGKHSLTVIGNDIYMFGGYSDGLSNDLMVFHPQQWIWERVFAKNEGPSPRCGHTAWAVGRKLFLFGGLLVGEESNEVWSINIDTLLWTLECCEGAPPISRHKHTATLIPEKKIVYIHGGLHRAYCLNDIFQLDLKTMTWSCVTIENPPTYAARYSHTATLAPGDRQILFIGGRNNEFDFYDQLACFDIEDKVWSIQATSNTPQGRSKHSATLLGDKLYIFGGHNNDASHMNGLRILDISTYKWYSVSIRDNMPPVLSHEAVILPSGMLPDEDSAHHFSTPILIHGGFTSGNRESNLINVLHPVKSTFFLE